MGIHELAEQPIKALTRYRTYRSIRNDDLAPYDPGSLNRRCRHSHSCQTVMLPLRDLTGGSLTGQNSASKATTPTSPQLSCERVKVNDHPAVRTDTGGREHRYRRLSMLRV